MRKRGGIAVDFTGVESGGRSVEPGQYLLEVVEIEEKESQEGNAYLAWKWKVAAGPFKGVTIYDNTSLKSTALWRLKNLLEAMGLDVPNGSFTLSPSSYKGKTVMAMIDNEEYKGKSKSRIMDFVRGGGYESQSSLGPKTSGPLKGSKVTFEYDGQEMEGEVTALEAGGKLIVKVRINDEDEEWELSASEVKLKTE